MPPLSKPRDAPSQAPSTCNDRRISSASNTNANAAFSPTMDAMQIDSDNDCMIIEKPTNFGSAIPPRPSLRRPQRAANGTYEAMKRDPSPPANPSGLKRAKTAIGQPSPIKVQRKSVPNKNKDPQPKIPPPALVQPIQFYRDKPTTPGQSAVNSTATTPKANGRTAGSTAGKKLDHNIEQVCFGDIAFDSWFPCEGFAKEIVGRPVAEGRKMLDMLYVCKHCFKYTTNSKEYVKHYKFDCSRRPGGHNDMVPGRRVYVHAETEWADESGEEGTWEVWEVDGEDDTLYCQNLSLFGKLWLDNKSIFFDVGNFKYYLLVFHGPSQDEHIGGNYIDGERQVVGFFSKEKMSWDHNNLACIVVFPPWQHKSLGNLLIGVSYEISKREKVLGGPEKPISESGKRSYMKYWGSVIANFVINDLPSEDITISLDDLAQATWISKEDCLEALKIMGISEGNGKKRGDAWVLHKCIIREWLQETKTSLVPIVNPDGFHDGLFVREASTDEEDENEEDFLTASMLVTRGGSAQTDGGFHDYSHSNRGGLLGV